ncbi:MAG: nicotinamide-nucleotide amidohydrolase family protein [Chloroflexi bacterium]|nr:nicotinamide-nucleotide amidohydrolase family protein [Chloroflexota bacterium]
MVDKTEAEVRAILGDIFWGVGDDTQESVAGRALLSKGLTLAVAESFTGGFLAHMLATAADSERYFQGGLIAATDEVKVALGLDKNLVSSGDRSGVARAMAVLARQKMGATVGIGIEGESGVEPESGMVPGTVFIAIDSDEADLHTVQSYSGRLYQMKRRAAYYALFDLVKLLKA